MKKNLVSIILVTLGLSLVLWQPFVNFILSPHVLSKEQEELLSLSAEQYAENSENVSNQIKAHVFDYDSVQSLSSLSTSVDIDHDLAVGEIIIPSINVHLPILTGVNNETLKAAIGTMKPNQVMGKGNYALAGHNSRNPQQLFAPIRRLQTDDRIIITDKTRQYIYIVTFVKVVMPEKIDVIYDVVGKELVTLVSCYSDDGSDRIIVQGELEEIKDY